MPTGLPDYQTPVNIAAQTLANLSVDIAAQTMATLGVNIKAQDLASIAIDIASQTLSELAIKTSGVTKIAIDIAAQTLSELAIKTSGATKLAIDVAAQTLSAMNINITAQDLAQLVIKIAAQSVGVYVERDWASTQDNDHSATGSATVNPETTTTIISETVAAGKVIYIDEASWSVNVQFPSNPAYVELKIAGVTVFQLGFVQSEATTAGAGGSSIINPFSTPKKATAGQIILLTITNPAASYQLTGRANYGGRQYNA